MEVFSKGWGGVGWGVEMDINMHLFNLDYNYLLVSCRRRVCMIMKSINKIYSSGREVESMSQIKAI